LADLRAVIFDYYGTLAELDRPMRERLFDDLAAEIRAGLALGEAMRDWRGMVENDAHVRFGGVRPPLDGECPPFRTFRDVWLTRCGVLFRSWNVDAEATLGADMYARSHAEAMAYPDVVPALESLRSGFRLAVLSDADTDFLTASIERNKLVFEAVVSSEDVGAYKPHVSMFRAVCGQLAIEPEKTAYVGDNPWADMAGARNAGMRAVWINRYETVWPESQEPPDATIRSLVELPAVLDGR
jgi:putative hydrolase of the HAD superfamily